ncbi:hypothetical protein [Neorhizobium sp. SOG26]|uniref:hypothetical protein n=1 Tax=Neorhizobium sp. SOG26 TaxID=2060726 RepID=UPI001237579C|nr:hypothetical protein [Neorhizobium sp. SOG26]
MRGKTVWKNVADNWRCLVSVREGKNWSIQDIIFDGDRYNHPSVAASTDAVRGDAIIFWNEISPVEKALIKGCGVKNTSHYGIGIQNVSVKDLDILENWGYDCGGDFVDIKAFAAHPKENLRIIGNTARRIGTNWQGRLADGDGPQAAFDIRGACQVAHNTVYELDSYDASQLGNDGFRVNADLNSNESRKGGARSILTGNRVISSKLSSEGSGDVKRVRGLVINDERVIVRGHYNRNCYIGTLIESAGDSVANYVDISGVINEACRGAAAGSGMGTQIGNGTKGHSIYATNIDCGTGFVANCQLSSGTIINVGCDLGHSMSVLGLSLSSFEFISIDNVSPANIPGASNNKRGDLTVWDSIQPIINLRTTFNGNWTAPFLAGAIRFWKEDTSGAGAGMFASIDYRFNATAGSTGGYYFTSVVDGAVADIAYVGFDQARFYKNVQVDGNITVIGILSASARGLSLAAGNVPASASAQGIAGQIARDANFIYVCTATDTWKRAALSTW